LHSNRKGNSEEKQEAQAALLLLMALVFSACNSKSSKTIQATQPIHQTVAAHSLLHKNLGQFHENHVFAGDGE
jgi:hypothetical protein